VKLLAAENCVLRRQVEEDKDEVEELKDRVGNFKVQMQGREVRSRSCIVFQSHDTSAYQISVICLRLSVWRTVRDTNPVIAIQTSLLQNLKLRPVYVHTYEYCDNKLATQNYT